MATLRKPCRALALLFALVAVSSACGSTSTETTSASSSTTVAGAGAGTTVAKAPGSTSVGTVPSATGPAVIKVIDTPYGKALGGGDGKVLYAWDAETGPDSQCVAAACVEKWPPLIGTSFTVEAGLESTSFTLVDRPDGTKQVAVGGRRLYTMKDDAPGEANCQGGDGWFILHPDGSKNPLTEPM